MTRPPAAAAPSVGALSQQCEKRHRSVAGDAATTTTAAADMVGSQTP